MRYHIPHDSNCSEPAVTASFSSSQILFSHYTVCFAVQSHFRPEFLKLLKVFAMPTFADTKSSRLFSFDRFFKTLVLESRDFYTKSPPTW